MKYVALLQYNNFADIANIIDEKNYNNKFDVVYLVNIFVCYVCIVRGLGIRHRRRRDPMIKVKCPFTGLNG